MSGIRIQTHEAMMDKIVVGYASIHMFVPSCKLNHNKIKNMMNCLDFQEAYTLLLVFSTCDQLLYLITKYSKHSFSMIFHRGM